jgi:diguanylate cyclase (GGDEF)-like protein
MNGDLSGRSAATATVYVRELAQRLWHCRLCKSVTFSVFVLILAVESVILVPSAHNFRENALRLLEQHAITLVRSALLVTTGQPRADELRELLQKLIDDRKLLGLRILAGDGATLAYAGDADFADWAFGDLVQDSEGKIRRVTHDGTRLDLAWNSAVGATPVIVLGRMDSSNVQTDLTAFVLRIAGLVALIVGVVTTGTMFVLYRSVLGPILRLRRSMLRAAEEPDRAEVFQVVERPRDELGDVFQTHNEMLVRVAESKRADRLRAEEQARFLGRHDTLTGLPNRTFFLEHLRQALPAAYASGNSVVVLVLNLSGFRNVNDGFGQHIGDEVLVQIARRLSQGIGSGDFLARIGGDEFGIARVGAVSPDQAAALTENILAHVTHPLHVQDADIRLQGRIGIAYGAAEQRDPNSVLHDAELALSRIRRDPVTRYQFFSPEMGEAARRWQEMEHALRQALEQRAFQLFYQPKVSLAGNGGAAHVNACEALLRWQHPAWGWVPPLKFIPIAEATGLIGPIGAWVIEEACRQIRRWLDAGLIAPRIAVNLSAHQFHDPALPDTVSAAIASSRVDAALLELEITESVAMRNVEKTAVALSKLRRLGVQLSIDDFGTGYSSLSYLRRFEVDSIKIDKSFVDDIGRDSSADAICEAIIRLGHSLGKRVVAEGVETEIQSAFLHQRQCEEAQGNWFGRPMPPPEFASRLARRPR